MEITMKELSEFYNAVDIFSEKTLPLKGAFKINRYKKDLQGDYTFYQEKLGEILNTYSKKDEEGKTILSEDKTQVMIQEDKLDECAKKLEELMTMSVSINDYDFTIEDLGDIDCTPNELEVLMPFFTE